MNVQEIRQIATQIGVKPGKLDKTNLVKTIQRQEGNFDCFATAYDNECDQSGCLWRKDCFSIAKKGRQS
jgi:hypothetical protein